MAKKDFKQTTAAAFISTAEPKEKPKPKPKTEPKGAEVPRGYKIVPETKSSRVQLLIPPTLKEDLKALADQEGISLNEIANEALQQYVERKGK